MATKRYITAQLIDITLTGTNGDIAENRVRAFIRSNLTAIFNRENYVSETTYDDYPALQATREGLLSSIADFVTISLTDATFKIPQTLFDAVGKEESLLEFELQTWLDLVNSDAESSFDIEAAIAAAAA